MNAVTGISKDQMGSTIASLPTRRPSKSINAAKNRTTLAIMSTVRASLLLVSMAGKDFATNGDKTIAPKSDIIKRVSQLPTLRVDFWMRKSPKPQQSIARNERPMPIPTPIVMDIIRS